MANAETGKRNLLVALSLVMLAALYFYLEPLSGWVARGLMKMDPGTKIGSAVEFFIYEAPKVIILLTGVVFFVGIVRSFFTPERTRRMLAGRNEFTGCVLASLLGVVTPFCSCSAVPLFIGFVTSGVPLGVTLSFLISSPMINEVALVLLFGLFGWKVAALYAGTGLIIAIFAGWIIGKLKLERWIEDWVMAVPVANTTESQSDWNDRIDAGWMAVKDIVGKVWIYVVAGIGIGAWIHGYVPENFMASIMGRDTWWAVPAAVIMGVPMYSNAAGIIPIVHALLEKGAALGTVLAFMMSVIALSLPEAIILRKVLKLQMIAVFFGVVALGIIIVGYLFNILM